MIEHQHALLVSSAVDESAPRVWTHPLVFPVYAAILSATVNIAIAFWRSRRAQDLSAKDAIIATENATSRTARSRLSANLTSHGLALFIFRSLKLVSCLALVALSVVASVQNGRLAPGTKSNILDVDGTATAGHFVPQFWVEIAQAVFYGYVSVLCALTLTLDPKTRRTTLLHTSVLLSIPFVIYAYRDVFPFCTFTLSPIDGGGWLLWSRIGILSFAAVLLPLLAPREYIPLDPKHPNEPNSEQTASPLSFMLFVFIDKLVYLGWKHPHLPYDLLPSLCDYDRTAYLRDRGSRHIFVPPGAKRRHLAFRLLTLFRAEYAWLASTTTLRAFLNFLAPISVNRLLNYIETRGEGAIIQPWVWILLFFLSPLISAILFQAYIFVATHALVQLEAILTQLIFEHALRIRVKNAAASTTPDATDKANPTTKTAKASNLEGRLNNLISSDLQAITSSRDFINIFIYSPLQMALCVWFLYAVLGWSALVGLAIMVAGMYVPGKIAKRIHAAQVSLSKATDERVQTVSENLGVLRLIKMFGYESKIAKQIADKRTKELDWLKKKITLKIINGVYNWILPITTMVATFFTYTYIMKQPLTPSTVFSSLTVFDTLRMELGRINWQIPAMINGKVSMDRVDDFLYNTELLDRYTETGKDNDELTATQFISPTADPEAIGFHNAVFSWDLTVDSPSESAPSTPSQRKFRLRINGDLFFKRGALNLILGPTGSGKTSILLALLGELHFIPSGPDSWFNLPRDGGIAYAAQLPWILNRTIKDNILFGEEFDAERYKQVLAQCALERDLELFAAGDATEVGEKGLTLSGGQKARISLARAVYSRAAIVLLDDVLSALDVHTARSVVNECLAGPLLQGRTVVLVTHNVAMAGKHAKNFVHVGSDGSITSSETIHNVAVENPDLLAQFAEEVEAVAKADEILDGSAAPPDVQAATEKSSGKLVVAEEINLGRVATRSLMLYFASMGGIAYWVALLGSVLANEGVLVILSWWLSVWSHQYEVEEDPSQVSVPFYLGCYVLLVLVGLVCYVASSLVQRTGSISASTRIHQLLAGSVLTATLRWLDKTPFGRMVSRFTQDIRAVDVTLPNGTEVLLGITSALILKLAAIVSFTPVYVIPGLALGAVSYIVGRIYIAAQLSTKREMSNSRSPVFSHFGAAISGLASIRAYGAEKSFKDQSLHYIDLYSRPARAYYNLNRWIGIRIDALGGLFSAGLAAYLLYVAKETNAANTGLLLNLAVGFSGVLIWWVRFLNDMEVSANSLERIQGYIDIEHEEEPTVRGKPPAAWPTSGELVVEQLSARYSQDGPEVLHRLSFQIPSGSKIGVVGRTGSGKSSLTLSLLRLIPTEGNVLYDGRLTRDINLESLRGAITIIPQQPELLSGTIRQNLDPFGDYDDALLNDALRSAGLFNLQTDIDDAERITLETSVSSGGGNFSLGQRQIIALARALVRRSKVLIMDEATASLDHETDNLVQKTLSTEFKDVTLITVAHRLQTVMNADKIMVLDAGDLVEFDSPANLLKRKDSAFKSLVDGSGDRDALYSMVK